MNIHGYIEFTWNDTILYVRAFGPFNEEGVNKASEDYLEQVSRKGNATFSVIEVWDEDSLGSPESMAIVSQMWHFLLENNCASIAIVVSNALQKAICEKLLPTNGRVFTSVDSAKTWVEELSAP